MRVFLTVIKNNFLRMLPQKSRFFLFTFLTLGAIITAVFLNNQVETMGSVAIIGNTSSQVISERLKVTILEEIPPKSDLVLGKYDAIVLFNDNGDFQVETLKNKEFENLISSLIENPRDFQLANSRKIGSSIIGFMMMFILMQGNTVMYLFAQDKEKKQINRIAASPISFFGYICGHSLFTFMFLLIPSMIILIGLKYVFAINLGFGLSSYLFLLVILCALSTVFSLLVYALVKNSESANMIISASVIITSVLSGSFFPLDVGNGIVAKLLNVLPQKAYLMVVGLLEEGKDTKFILPYFIYLLLIIVLFFIISVFKTKKDYINS